MNACRSCASVAMFSFLFIIVGIGQGAAAAVFVPASSRVSAAIVQPGLQGAFYDRNEPPGVLTTLARADAIIASSSPAATFVSTVVDYPNGFVDNAFFFTLGDLLGSDASMLMPSGAAALPASPMVARLEGVIRVTEEFDVDPSNGTIDIRFALGSDDGSRLRIGGQTVIALDGIGVFFDSLPAQTASFEAPGLYPVEIVWYDHFGGLGIEWYSSIPGGPNSGAPAGTTGIVPASVVGSVPPAGGIKRLVNPGATCPSAPVGGPPEYDTIQQAVAHSNPGDIVAVCPGTYQGDVGVAVAHLTLQAIGLVKLVGPGADADQYRVGFGVHASGVNIQGFDISGYDLCGIDASHADAITVMDSRLHHNDIGICIRRTKEARVINNAIEHNRAGVYFGETHPQFEGTVGGEVSGNRIVNNRWAIAVSGCSGTPTIERNVVAGNSGGIHVRSELMWCDPVIRRNQLQGTGLDQRGSGIILDGRIENAVVTHNHIRSFETGIQFCCECGFGYTPAECTSTSATISRNHLMSNGVGIDLLKSTGVAVTKNHVSHSAVVDCRWDGWGVNEFDANQCRTEEPPGTFD